MQKRLAALWCALVGVVVVFASSWVVVGSEDQVQVWVTTPNRLKLLEREAALRFDDSAAADLIIDVDPMTTYQTMDGFGAAVTGSAAYLIQSLPTEARRALINELFGTDGIGLSVVRHTIGASDFSLASTTYNDTPGNVPDFELKHFSVDPDRAHVIPTLQEIRTVAPWVKVFGSPWSAPAWMKQARTLNGSRLRPDPRYYQAFADYLARYIQAYAQEGIPISAITVQNEPLHTSLTYPTMRMTASEQREFIKAYLGPTFAREGIATKILVYDHNWDRPDYALAVLNDPEVAQYVDGSAWHCYAGEPEAMSEVHAAHPDKHIYFTECSGGAWSTNFRNNLHWNMTKLMIGATRNWAKTVLLWNLALGPDHGPKNGGCQDCRGVVTIDPETGHIERNVEYYALGHAAKFVRPGAVRIESTHLPGRLESVAFFNPDGTVALIVLNPQIRPVTFAVRWQGQSFTYTLPAGAVATLTWQG